MTSAQEQFLLSVDEKTRGKLSPAVQPFTVPKDIRRGVVLAVNTDGTYKVRVVSNTGGGVKYDGLRAWGDSPLAVSDKVALVWDGNSPLPFILATGGSGSGALVGRHGHTSPNDGGVVGFLGV